MPKPANPEAPFWQARRRTDISTITFALKNTNGSVSRAAASVGLETSTFYRYCIQYGIDPQDYKTQVTRRAKNVGRQEQATAPAVVDEVAAAAEDDDDGDAEAVESGSAEEDADLRDPPTEE